MIKKLKAVKYKLKCPQCGEWCKQHSIVTRRVADLGSESEKNWSEITTSKHYCKVCRKHFRNYHCTTTPRAHHTNRVKAAAIRLVVDGDMTLDEAKNEMRRRYLVHVPSSTLYGWLKYAGFYLEMG